MHQEDDNYDEDYDDSHESFQDHYKHLFKFDDDAWEAWGKMLYNALDELNQYSHQWYVYGWTPKQLPVNSFSSNTEQAKNSFQYLGVNYFNEGVFKYKYFVKDSIATEYYNHLKQHSAHFLQQPSYYKGLYDILN